MTEDQFLALEQIYFDDSIPIAKKEILSVIKFGESYDDFYKRFDVYAKAWLLTNALKRTQIQLLKMSTTHINDSDDYYTMFEFDVKIYTNDEYSELLFKILMDLACKNIIVLNTSYGESTSFAFTTMSASITISKLEFEDILEFSEIAQLKENYDNKLYDLIFNVSRR